MVFLYRIEACGSELHGEDFSIQAQSRAEADARADYRVRDTFAWSSRRDARAVFVGEYVSRRALETADTLPAPPSKRHRHDYRDGDVCSTCDAMRSGS